MKLKVLATTGLALTLGLTSIGTNVTPTYAAVQAVNPNPDIENNKDWYSSQNMLKFAPFSTTGFKITSQDKVLKSINYAENDNSGNSSPATLKSAEKSFATTDSLTVNASTELSVANEVSASGGLPGIASVTAKFTAGFKFSAGFSKVTSETRSLKYGGDPLVAEPNQLVRVDYFLEEMNTTGFMNTGTRITEIGDKLMIRGGGIDYQPGNVSGEGVYNAFKRIEELNNNGNISINMKRPDRGFDDFLLTIPKGELSNYFFIDDVAKTVSTVKEQASFTGVSGTGLKMKTSTINSQTNEKTTSAEQTIPQS
ncbi:MAG TPA: hypothetical protein DEU03_18470 [Bacillus sp. (in: Bacteria)]|uniref:Uncharacterized protein n=1 Tax=Bacillus thuringiensis TaxID=1428 RepID=A0A9X5RLH0_BACTU|nr:hypothetical protein [Bacillus cereus]OFC89120.1 hypothetical protein BTGOE4_56540 [Bacillus thuringiensis]SME74038.1 hypothetical protein BACERE00198_05625 [Bacillus cereus]HCF55076.1 hypothetical protein [Bacillus sp. (in: firmicutes)]